MYICISNINICFNLTCLYQKITPGKTVKKRKRINLLKSLVMRRNLSLLKKRNEFVKVYVNNNQDKQMKLIVSELSERLFLSERTIYNIMNQ